MMNRGHCGSIMAGRSDMEPREFEGQSRILNAPAGWNEREPIKCGMLPIRDTKVDGIPCMQSMWKPDADELKHILAGGHIVLTIYGRGHPPVWVGVESVTADADRKPA